MRQCATFITEDGDRVDVDYWLDVPNHLTGEIFPAYRATPDAAVILPPSLGLYSQEKLALRCEREYRSFCKRERRLLGLF